MADNPTPITITAPPAMPATPAQEAETSLTTKGQRKVNLIWEVTQGIIAVSITGAVTYIEVNQIPSSVLQNAFFLIVSMYFIRTNHTLIGGVGKKTLEGR